jgi:hypothetical protein
MTMLQIPVQDLRRVARSLQHLRGETIEDCVMRSDLRHLKIELASGRMVVIGVEADDQGRPHLAVDVVIPSDEASRQLEVGLDPSGG